MKKATVKPIETTTEPETIDAATAAIAESDAVNSENAKPSSYCLSSASETADAGPSTIEVVGELLEMSGQKNRDVDDPLLTPSNQDGKVLRDKRVLGLGRGECITSCVGAVGSLLCGRA